MQVGFSSPLAGWYPSNPNWSFMAELNASRQGTTIPDATPSTPGSAPILRVASWKKLSVASPPAPGAGGGTSTARTCRMS